MDDDGTKIMIDLKSFCGNDETRAYLMKPFSVGDFTYATNGHIMVRVARQEGVEPPGKDFDPNAPLKDIETAPFAAPPAFELPALPDETDECEACDGRGTEHECPSCQCQCDYCDGTGYEKPEWNISTEVGGAIFALRYVRKVLTLPNVQIAQPDPEKPLLFRFDGGVGALMPRKGALSEHIKIFK